MKLEIEKSARLKDFLEKEEGFRARPYRCTAGALTVGFGTNLDAGITRRQAEALMTLEIEEDILPVLRKNLPWFDTLNEVRQTVLISMAYQMGTKGLLGFKTTLMYIGQGNYAAAATQMLSSKWARQTPNRARRQAEMMRTGEWP